MEERSSAKLMGVSLIGGLCGGGHACIGPDSRGWLAGDRTWLCQGADRHADRAVAVQARARGTCKVWRVSERTRLCKPPGPTVDWSAESESARRTFFDQSMIHGSSGRPLPPPRKKTGFSVPPPWARLVPRRGVRVTQIQVPTGGARRSRPLSSNVHLSIGRRGLVQRSC
jgi:hypothetical protein